QDYAKGECVDFLNADFKYEDIAVTNFIMLSTFRTTNGAVAMFYPGVKERLAELFGGDYYVAFTSVNEARLYPVHHKPLSDLKAELEHNNALLENRSFLTGRVYRYGQVRGDLIEV
ncbi:MAG: hypothetical protein J6Z22_01285, partial [Lachnospiraceae bacterium]|nr:hypothetical protein [Lachnospiraceae bacterium]